jgi:hypothetical protein
MDSIGSGLYAFHKANIHERRLVARACAAFPAFFLCAFFVLLGYGLRRNYLVLLVTSAVFCTATWIWIFSTAILSILGAVFTNQALKRSHRKYVQQPARNEDLRQGLANSVCVDQVDAVDKVAHMIVLPNYKEDEGLLAETLLSLGEADERESFYIVLAMEEREPNSLKKGAQLKEEFEKCFASIAITVHPIGLSQVHQDNSEDDEVPGKASNLKWAVREGFKEFKEMGFLQSRSSIILTVADADCIFHPCYFSSVSREFNILRENPGTDHLWTMYQAPQLPYRNYYDSIACCRIWGYVSSTFETGGVCNLSFGGTHMTFSGYSLPLQLALDAGAWDGDVIAEDHHAFLKCFFYSALASAEATSGACVPQLKVQPVYLPVKSTSVAANGYWDTCVERWWQAKRHAQGASELSYALLATYDAVVSLPWKLQSFAFYWQVSKFIAKLFCMHLLPTCQGVAFLAVWLVTFYHGGHHPMCPHQVRLMDLLKTQTFHIPVERSVICGLAGAWVMIWPLLVLTVLITIANNVFLQVAFIRESRVRRAESVWHAEDGGEPHGCFAPRFAALVQTALDCTFLLSIIMIPYGFFANAAAYFDIAIHGNRVKYITASKPSVSTYGTFQGKVRNRLRQRRIAESRYNTVPSDTSSTRSDERTRSDVSDEEAFAVSP